MNLNDSHNVEDFKRLAKKNYHRSYFIISMVVQMMKIWQMH